MTICKDCGNEYVYSPFLQCMMCPLCTPKKLAPIFQQMIFPRIMSGEFTKQDQEKLDELDRKRLIEKYRNQYGIISFDKWIELVVNRCENCIKSNPIPCNKHEELSKLIDVESLPGVKKMFCDCCNEVHPWEQCPILDDEPESDFIDEMFSEDEFDG